jgi:hypothetical protein
MKTLIFLFISVVAIAQVPDTLYTTYSPITAKKVTVTKTTEIGPKKMQEIETLDFEKATKTIEALQRDTTQLVQYGEMIEKQEIQLGDEKIRVRKLYREAVRQLRQLEKLVISLK